MRKLSMSLMIVVGLFWLVGAFVLDYPAKTQAVDNLTNTLRPAFTDEALQQAKTDVGTATSFAGGFQTAVVPALAEQLGVTPAVFVDGVGTEYPAVGAGLAQLPEILAYFDGVQQTIADQQANFHAADAIPTKTLPNTTVHWLFVSLGVGSLAIGVVGLVGRRRGVAVAGAALGVVVIATTLVLGVPAKTAAVDDLTAAFRPVFTEQGAAQARGYFDTLQAMDEQLNAEALPGIAGLLNITPRQLSASLAENFPAAASGLQQIPAILTRIDGLVTAVESNIDNFRLADSIPTAGLPTTAVQWQLIVPAAVLVVAGVAGALSGRRARPESNEIESRELEAIGA